VIDERHQCCWLDYNGRRRKVETGPPTHSSNQDQCGCVMKKQQDENAWIKREFASLTVWQSGYDRSCTTMRRGPKQCFLISILTLSFPPFQVCSHGTSPSVTSTSRKSSASSRMPRRPEKSSEEVSQSVSPWQSGSQTDRKSIRQSDADGEIHLLTFKNLKEYSILSYRF
jgi:hypothetical protein